MIHKINIPKADGLLEFIRIGSNGHLIPKLDRLIPGAGQNFAGLVRMPENVRTDIVVCLEAGQQFGGLPVPDEYLAVRIAGDQVGHLGREIRRARVAGHHVPFEDLLVVELEAIYAGERLDFVVHKLAG